MPELVLPDPATGVRAATGVGVAPRVRVAAGVVARLVLRSFDLGLQTGGGLGGPTRLFLGDELAELGFGVDPRLLVLTGALLGLLLGRR